VLEFFNCRIGDGGEGSIGTDFNKFWFKSEGFVTNGVASAFTLGTDKMHSSTTTSLVLMRSSFNAIGR
jgi:hypothetical protein